MQAPFMACIKQVKLHFPPPTGPRVLHFVQRAESLDGVADDTTVGDGPCSPLLVLDELAVKVFGVDSCVRVNSKETLRKDIKSMLSSDGHCEVCRDADIRAILSSADVIGKTASKVYLLSVKATLSLLRKRGAGQGMLSPFLALDVGGMLNDTMSGGLERGPQAPATDAGAMALSRELHTTANRRQSMSARLQAKHARRAARAAAKKAAKRFARQQDRQRQAQSQVAAVAVLGGGDGSRLEHVGAQGGGASDGSEDDIPLDGLDMHSDGPSERMDGDDTVDDNEDEAYGGGAAGGRDRLIRSALDREAQRFAAQQQDPATVSRQHRWHTTAHEAADRSAGRHAACAKQAVTTRVPGPHNCVYCATCPTRCHPHHAMSVQAIISKPGNGRYTQEQLQRSYGLKPTDTPKRLARHIEVYMTMASDTGINLARTGVYNSPQAPCTLDRTRKDMAKFFGFLHHIKGWDAQLLDLQAYSNTDIVNEFLGFLSARGVRITELVQQATLARRVNTFLCNLLGGAKRNAASLAVTAPFIEAEVFMTRLQKELTSKRRRDKGAIVT
jgi:hypothetical protein